MNLQLMQNSSSSMILNIPDFSVETLNGYLDCIKDALIVCQLCIDNKLSLFEQRPANSQLLIKSGSIFVYNNKSGIKRWIDGKLWSPSKIVGGKFLVYKELSSKMKRKTKFKGEGEKGIICSKGIYQPKENGFLKKTITIKINENDSYHLVSYYKKIDVKSGILLPIALHQRYNYVDINFNFVEKKKERKKGLKGKDKAARDLTFNESRDENVSEENDKESLGVNCLNLAVKANFFDILTFNENSIFNSNDDDIFLSNLENENFSALFKNSNIEKVCYDFDNPHYFKIKDKATYKEKTVKLTSNEENFVNEKCLFDDNEVNQIVNDFNSIDHSNKLNYGIENIFYNQKKKIFDSPKESKPNNDQFDFSKKRIDSGFISDYCFPNVDESENLFLLNSDTD
ncbi:hypothetical protein HK099_000632 [Clydaea vesicula]|uniref:Uncharacterized protein n=1 Tax=Clydaea vesicula TaxID=447962 RepID=A0AAD5TV57_9FUNG|nr:hypothetical protein HK099_000632 [Clydaea vesicula]KAJ3393312.1 hypothetical protein HDU92_007873 [Lobulomyces angularis]